ncbi:response regulator [Aquisalinus flavus]|uniref:histidine kinase n=1 Tax=Aquisalinus flavus TaxID=1526572 RepID=A0A8J2Y5R1_9PROT|nr:response regulator [Aquisalinus flavus]MBD0425459.1 response regulator [Aquisalinus flavus]UNE48903.1 response regulator [Aquisalinus flavus]GGD15880.1 hypothetical protein GCM10011342_25850 [Aquisalinus flavus]
MRAEEKNILYRANLTSAPIWLVAMTLEYFIFDLAGHSAWWTGWLAACYGGVAMRMGTSLMGLKRKTALVHRLMIASLVLCGSLFALPVLFVHPLSDPHMMFLIALVLSIATSGAHTLALSRIGLLVWVVPSFGSFIFRMATMSPALYPDYTNDLRAAMIIGCVLYGSLLILLGLGSARRIRHTLDLQESLKQANRENRRRAREAEAATSAKSDFLAMMSHEIRTPLNGVLGMAQALSQEKLGDRQRDQVETIIDSGKSLMGILNDVLDISKIEAGKMEIDRAHGDLHQTLGSVHSLFVPIAGERKIGLTLTLEDSLPRHASFDPVRVRQCLTNLMSNAVKFTREGEVAITAWAEPAVPGLRLGEGAEAIVKVEVRDTGIGMDEATLDRLFKTFSQADGSTTRNFGGTGLGLAISRRLARMMGGDITAASTPAEGSVFTLTFTAIVEAAASDPDETQAEPDAAANKSLRVLVVDDIAVNRQVVRVFIEPAGYNVTEAGDGAAALECLASDSFDAVLLDIHMPVMDGYETISRIRASGAPWADIPVIALTADAMAGDREKLLARGMDAYVSKPIDRRDLLRQLAAMQMKQPERRLTGTIA